MRITQEADYAFRIIRCLGVEYGQKKGSSEISEESAIPYRFTFKILRKLTNAGLTKSIRGKGGGYLLAKEPKVITLLEVIEVIDGPLLINKCLEEEYSCSLHGDSGMCKIHHCISAIGVTLRDELAQHTFEEFV